MSGRVYNNRINPIVQGFKPGQVVYFSSSTNTGKTQFNATIFQQFIDSVVEKIDKKSIESQEVRKLVWQRKRKKWTNEAIRFALVLNDYNPKYIDRALEEWYNDNRKKKWTIKGQSPDRYIGRKDIKNDYINIHRTKSRKL